MLFVNAWFLCFGVVEKNNALIKTDAVAQIAAASFYFLVIKIKDIANSWNKLLEKSSK